MPNQFTTGSVRTQYQWLVRAITNHTSNDCLLWPFSRFSDGYGSCCFQGRRQRAHRVAYYVKNGHFPVPVGRHACDTPLCFNPNHITDGTPQDNTADMVERGRSLKGARNPNAKLNEDLVRKIRQEFKPGMSMIMARQYGVSDETILGIVRRVKPGYWLHVS